MCGYCEEDSENILSVKVYVGRYNYILMQIKIFLKMFSRYSARLCEIPQGYHDFSARYFDEIPQISSGCVGKPKLCDAKLFLVQLLQRGFLAQLSNFVIEIRYT